MLVIYLKDLLFLAFSINSSFKSHALTVESQEEMFLSLMLSKTINSYKKCDIPYAFWGRVF
jgi:hypothetical protein